MINARFFALTALNAAADLELLQQYQWLNSLSFGALYYARKHCSKRLRMLPERGYPGSSRHPCRG